MEKYLSKSGWTFLRTVILLVIITAVFLVLNPYIARAQQSLFKISPAVIEKKLNPGNESTAVIKITNISDSSQEVELRTVDIIGLEEGNKPIFSEKREYLAASWVSLAKKDVVLQAGESNEIGLQVEVPSTAPLGKYLVLVGFQEQLVDSKFIGTLLTINVVGSRNDDLVISKFNLNKTVYNEQPLQLQLEVTDTGNSVIRPYGSLILTDWRGREVNSIDINVTSQPILPNHTADFSQVIDSSDLSIGRYQLLLNLVYGESRKTAVEAISFWILPFKTILIVCLVVVSILFLLYLGIIFYIKSKDSTNARQRGNATLEVKQLYKRLIFLTIGVLILIIILLSLMYLYL